MSTTATTRAPAWDLAHGPLRVDESRRFLIHADGTPFFYLADTAWELFHRLTREEIALYLDKRRQQGFTVVQAVALAEFDGLNVPNAYGHRPLVENDPARPDVRPDGQDDYWKHVDWAIACARENGITVALLPTWGDKLGPKAWGQGPEVFDEANARAYGRFLGERYRDTPNLIWVIGGDRPLHWEGRDFRPLWRALVAGIKDARAPQLMTFHPVGGQSSSLWMHEEPWLDFNMLQSGHARQDESNWAMVAADYCRHPPRPVIDGEPRYENHCVNFKPDVGWFDAYDMRQAAYWALFAGACGHTYGCHDIWQFLQPGRRPVSHARGEWRQSLDLPGAWDMQHVRTVFLSRPVLGRVPDPSLIYDGQGVGAEHVEACRDKDGRYALVYVPTGRAVTLNLARLRAATTVRAFWFDPRNGETTPGAEVSFDRLTTRQVFVPPGTPTPGRGNDWVLVVDDVNAGFAPPSPLSKG